MFVCVVVYVCVVFVAFLFVFACCCDCCVIVVVVVCVVVIREHSRGSRIQLWKTLFLEKLSGVGHVEEARGLNQAVPKKNIRLKNAVPDSDMYGISVWKPSKSSLFQSISSLTGMLVIISGVHVCGSLLHQMKLLPVSVWRAKPSGQSPSLNNLWDVPSSTRGHPPHVGPVPQRIYGGSHLRDFCDDADHSEQHEARSQHTKVLV